MEHEGPGLLTEIAFGTEANAMLTQPVMACLAGFVGGLRAVVRATTGDDLQTGALLSAAKVEELEPVALSIAWRIDRLREADPRSSPDATDAFALGRGYGQARVRIADAGMRVFLRNAAVRAFDLETYHRGETLLLLATVGQLVRADLDALEDPTRAETQILHRLTHHALVLGGSLTPMGLRLRDLVAPPEPIPHMWVPPWDRVVALETGVLE